MAFKRTKVGGKKVGRKKPGPKPQKPIPDVISPLAQRFKKTGKSKYDPAVIFPAIMELMAQGVGKRSLCLHLGIVPSTFWRWEKRYPELRKVLKQGTALAEAWWLEQGRVNIHNKGFNAILYMMNMQNRFGWTRSPDGSKAEPSKHEHLHKHKHEYDLSNTSTEELETLEDILKKAKFARPKSGTRSLGEAESEAVHSVPVAHRRN